MEVMIITLLVLFLAFKLFTTLSNSRKRLPPGPTPLPVIGSLHLLGSQPHKSLAKLAKAHGPVMSLRLGQLTTIVISSSAAAKEVLQKQDLAFANRFVSDTGKAIDHAKFSVVFMPVASHWRTLRKIMNSNIFSGSSLDANQGLRVRKVEELIEYCKKSSERGEGVDVGGAAFRTTLNLLSNTIFSKDLTDPFSDSGKDLKEIVSKITEQVGKPNLADFFPVLGRFDLQGIKRRLTIHGVKLQELFDDLIREKLEEMKSPGGVKKGNDVLHTLLATIEEHPQELDKNITNHLCQDLFVAGTDTSSNSLEWAMAELLKNSGAMRKAEEELSRVIGKGKIVKETEIPNLPYLQCIVKETLRLHPPVPFLIPRGVEQDVEIFNYIVPKGSQVLVNAWAIGRDPSVWEAPLDFKPERFWELGMDVRGRDFELIPFGAGRRICPGLPLAMRMVPVMLGSLLNCFDWKLEDGMAPEELDMEERFGITVQKAQPLIAFPSSN